MVNRLYITMLCGACVLPHREEEETWVKYARARFSLASYFIHLLFSAVCLFVWRGRAMAIHGRVFSLSRETCLK